MERIGVIFVCMGNICRSPTAEGVFLRHVEQAGLSDSIHVDSAGTHAYHIKEPPDVRAQRAAQSRGYDLSPLRARRVSAEDFDKFEYVVAMDYENHRNLQQICPPGLEDRLSLFLSFAPDSGVDEVPDPYYGGVKGFDRVLDLVEAASHGLLREIRTRHSL